MHTDIPSEWAEVAGYYGPDTLTWRLGSEAAMLLGGGREHSRHPLARHCGVSLRRDASLDDAK